MDTDELRQLIVQKRELLARETFSRRAFNRCENIDVYKRQGFIQMMGNRNIGRLIITL